MKTALIIERVLELNEDTRNSDKILMLKVWEIMGLHLNNSQKDRFLDLPDPQYIGRLRRKFQEQGRFLADNKVKTVRVFKSMVVQQNMPKASIKTVEQVLEELPE